MCVAHSTRSSPSGRASVRLVVRRALADSSITRPLSGAIRFSLNCRSRQSSALSRVLKSSVKELSRTFRMEIDSSMENLHISTYFFIVLYISFSLSLTGQTHRGSSRQNISKCTKSKLKHSKCSPFMMHSIDATIVVSGFGWNAALHLISTTRVIIQWGYSVRIFGENI